MPSPVSQLRDTATLQHQLRSSNQSSLEIAVPDPDVFRERARRCRELLKIAVGSEIVQQLTVWARDFDEEANKIDAELAAARRALRHSMRRLA